MAYGLGTSTAIQHPVEKLYYRGGLHSDIFPLMPRGVGSKTVSELVEKLSYLPLRCHPGREIQYSIAYDVLARLVEVVSGMSFDRYIDEHICAPLKMRDTVFILSDSQRDRLSSLYALDEEGVIQTRDEMSVFGYSQHRTFIGGDNMLSTADDWIRFATMLCNGGCLDGVRLLSQQSVAEMTAYSDFEPPKSVVNMAGTEVGHQVGYGVMVLNDVTSTSEYSARVGEYWWAGAANTCFWVEPSRQITFVLMIQLFLSHCRLREELKSLVLKAISHTS